MANYIKPFATNPDASVMTNDELANADELKRGFIPKSKADSRLIGKLIQNSTAGAYVLGEFTSSVGGVDVDPSNATTFSSDFQNALKTYITRHAPQSDLSGYQLKTEASSTYATRQEMTTGLGGKADAAHTHTTAQVTGLDAALAGKQNKGDYATNAAVNGKININGARGLIAGYESIGNHTTITDSSPDSNETAAAVTVNNGSANVCWTKIVHLTSASPSVNLGSSWKWQNGTSPELKQNGFLVLCWCNTMGLAVYNNVL